MFLMWTACIFKQYILTRKEPPVLENEPAENNHTGTDAESTYNIAEEEQAEQNTVPSMNKSAGNAPL